MLNPARPSRRAAYLLTVLISLSGLRLRAQTADSGPAPGASADNPITLSEFEVTASQEAGYRATNSTAGSRTNEPLQNVPLNVQVVTQDFMHDTAATDFAGTFAYVAGVSDDYAATAGLGNNAVNIRGLPSSYNLKDFFRWYTISDPFDTDRVEVLKGPAAVLYTQAFPGGAINTVSKTPEAADFQRGEVTIGSYSMVRSTVDVNQSEGPISVRFNGLYSYNRTSNDYEADKKTGFAPSISFHPYGGTVFTVQVEYLDFRNNFQGGISEFTAAVPALGVAAGDLLTAAPYTARFMGPSAKLDITSLNFEGTLQQRINENLSAEVVYSYERYNKYLFRPFSTNYAGIGYDTGGYFVTQRWLVYHPWNSLTSGKAQLLYNFKTGPVENKLLLGADGTSDHYTNVTQGAVKPGTTTSLTSKIYLQPGANFSFTPGTSFANTATDNQLNPAAGYFATLQSSYDDGLLRSSLGLRYDTYNADYLPGSPVLTDAQAATTIGGHKLSPMAGLLYTPVAGYTLYGLYSESYTPSNQRDDYDHPLPPETGAGYEFGLKTQTLGGRLSGTFSYFNTDISNIPQNDLTPPANATNPSPYKVSGKINDSGFDLSLIYSPVAGWDIVPSYEHVHVLTIASLTPATIGQRAVDSTPDAGAVFTRYSFQNPSLKGLYVGAGYRYRGKAIRRYVNNAAQESDVVDPVDLLAGYNWKLRKTSAELSFNVKNVGNQAAIVLANGFPTLAPLRWFGVSLTLKH